MSRLQQLIESSNPYKSLQSDAARLARKWKRTGLLENLKTETEVNNMSILLENQAKQLLVETSTTGGGQGAGSFGTGTGAQWAGIALPLVRKVFSQISAKEFLSVQPMNMPSGLAFFLDFKYGTDKAPFAKGDSLYGNEGDNKPFGLDGTGGLFGAGRFGYTINNAKSGEITASVAAADQYKDLKADDNYKADEWEVVAVPHDDLKDFDKTAIRGFYLEADGFDPNENQLPAFTTMDETNLYFLVSAGVIADPFTVKVVYTKQPTDGNRGDFEDRNTNLNPGNNPIDIPEINIDMKSEAIVAKTRKLKAVWTPEFAQDLNAYQSLDAESELTSIMSEYISLETDLELLDMLITNAKGGDEYWSAVNNRSITKDGIAANDLGFHNAQGQWFQTLGTKMNKLSNEIHRKTMRGGANFAVVSPTVATIIESIPGFASNFNGDVTKNQYAFGVQKSGTFNTQMTIYKNPYMTENTILMGYRGKQFLESGAVYAPYIPLIMTPLVYDPETFTPRKGLLTRFAKKVLRPEFYARIFVGDLNTL